MLGHKVIFCIFSTYFNKKTNNLKMSGETAISLGLAASRKLNPPGTLRMLAKT